MDIKITKNDGLFSEIFFTKASEKLPKLIKDKKCIFITDKNVIKYHSELIGENNIVIETGEEIKTIDTVTFIYSKLLEMGADRSTYIVGVGGGIVTDITGFVASTFMRGCKFGFVATTLLSQVDASVGGKNGVNFQRYKNIIGTFNQPDFVICDITTLQSLPKRELHGGFAEIIKMGLIDNKNLFEKISSRGFEKIISDPTFLQKIIAESVRMKSEIVQRDEKEHGERKKLNLGHTFAHAIEKSTHEFHHGEAVAIGIIMASEISEKLGYLNCEEKEIIKKTILNLGLPISCDIDKKTLFEALKSDKKKTADSISFIVMKHIGKSEIINLKFDELKKLMF